jgi:hypothetical protein
MDKLLWTNDVEIYDDMEMIDLMCELGNIIREYVVNSIGSDDYILVRASNLDWQGRSGYKKISLHDKSSRDIASDLLPSYDNTFMLYEGDDGLYAKVYSHDVPTGSIWRIIPKVDVEEVVGSIYSDCKYGDYDYLVERIKSGLNIDITRWVTVDVTDEYKYGDDCRTVIAYGGHAIIVYYDTDDNIIEMDFDEDDMEKEYIKTL